MTPHKYAIGDKVSFTPSTLGMSYLGGAYTIVRQLPSETRDWQYRIKSDNDAHERVVLESQLSSSSKFGGKL